MQMQLTPAPGAREPAESSVGTEEKVVQLLREQQEMMKEQWQNMETQRREMQAKMDALSAPKEAITDWQIEALEARLEVLHATKLLSDDALEQLEDILADFIALRASLKVVTMDHVTPIRWRARHICWWPCRRVSGRTACLLARRDARSATELAASWVFVIKLTCKCIIVRIHSFTQLTSL